MTLEADPPERLPTAAEWLQKHLVMLPPSARSEAAGVLAREHETRAARRYSLPTWNEVDGVFMLDEVCRDGTMRRVYAPFVEPGAFWFGDVQAAKDYGAKLKEARGG